MVYRIPELSDDDFFEVEWKGVSYKLPLLQNVSLDAVERLSAVTDLEAVNVKDITEVFKALDPEFGKVAGELAASQLMGLFEALKEASSVSLGESESSAVSSPDDTVELSEPTS